MGEQTITLIDFITNGFMVGGYLEDGRCWAVEVLLYGKGKLHVFPAEQLGHESDDFW